MCEIRGEKIIKMLKTRSTVAPLGSSHTLITCGLHRTWCSLPLYKTLSVDVFSKQCSRFILTRSYFALSSVRFGIILDAGSAASSKVIQGTEVGGWLVGWYAG